MRSNGAPHRGAAITVPSKLLNPTSTTPSSA